MSRALPWDLAALDSAIQAVPADEGKGKRKTKRRKGELVAAAITDSYSISRAGRMWEGGSVSTEEEQRVLKERRGPRRKDDDRREGGRTRRRLESVIIAVPSPPAVLTGEQSRPGRRKSRSSPLAVEKQASQGRSIRTQACCRDEAVHAPEEFAFSFASMAMPPFSSAPSGQLSTRSPRSACAAKAALDGSRPLVVPTLLFALGEAAQRLLGLHPVAKTAPPRPRPGIENRQRSRSLCETASKLILPRGSASLVCA